MEENKVTDAIVKKVVRITVGAALAEEGDEPEDYVIGTFCFAKTVRAFALLTELAEAAGVGKMAEAATTEGVEGGFEQPVAPGFVTQLVTLLPKALREGVPAAHKLIGLTVTGNKRLAALEDDDEADVDAELQRVGRHIARIGSSEEVLAVIAAGAGQMGLETIVKNLKPLMGLLRK